MTTWCFCSACRKLQWCSCVSNLASAVLFAGFGEHDLCQKLWLEWAVKETCERCNTWRVPAAICSVFRLLVAHCFISSLCTCWQEMHSPCISYLCNVYCCINRPCCSLFILHFSVACLIYILVVSDRSFFLLNTEADSVKDHTASTYWFAAE